MQMVSTVTGKIPADQLGFTQMHEHLYVTQGPATRLNPALLIDHEGKSAAELDAYRNAGGQSVLDAQPGGAGRDARVLQSISKSSGVQIITVTGFHLPVFYPEDHWTNTWEESRLYDHFAGELLNGLSEAPGITAGAVKAAMGGDGLTPRTAIKLRAAARAAAQAGVPLVLHTEKGFDAIIALRLCESAGLAPGHVLVCHADRDLSSYALHEDIAKAGAMLEYDTIGRFKYHDDESECRLITHMLDLGYEQHLLLSLDTTAKRLASYDDHAIGLPYLIRRFLPLLKRFGVSDQTIASIMIGNPMRVFQ